MARGRLLGESTYAAWTLFLGFVWRTLWWQGSALAAIVAAAKGGIDSELLGPLLSTPPAALVPSTFLSLDRQPDDESIRSPSAVARVGGLVVNAGMWQGLLNGRLRAQA